ncbi:MAG: MgtC/SapB family protein [Chitinispirillaceae bacterium]
MNNWETTLIHLVHLALAYGLALPIGWEREKDAQSAGLQTFPLVAVAACGYMLIGNSLFSGEEPQSRILFGIITGMGFIGGGAILKGEKTVTGTATAASLWNTGAIGTAVAWQRYDMAILLSTLNFLTLRYFSAVKKKVGGPQNKHKGPDRPDRNIIG